MPQLNLDFLLYPACLSYLYSPYPSFSSTFKIPQGMKIFTLELNFDIAWKDNQSCCEHLWMQEGRLELHGDGAGWGSGTRADLILLGQAPSTVPSLVPSLRVLYF